MGQRFTKANKKWILKPFTNSQTSDSIESRRTKGSGSHLRKLLARGVSKHKSHKGRPRSVRALGDFGSPLATNVHSFLHSSSSSLFCPSKRGNCALSRSSFPSDHTKDIGDTLGEKFHYVPKKTSDVDQELCFLNKAKADIETESSSDKSLEKEESETARKGVIYCESLTVLHVAVDSFSLAQQEKWKEQTSHKTEALRSATNSDANLLESSCDSREETTPVSRQADTVSEAERIVDYELESGARIDSGIETESNREDRARKVLTCKSGTQSRRDSAVAAESSQRLLLIEIDLDRVTSADGRMEGDGRSVETELARTEMARNAVQAVKKKAVRKRPSKEAKEGKENKKEGGKEAPMCERAIEKVIRLALEQVYGSYEEGNGQDDEAPKRKARHRARAEAARWAAALRPCYGVSQPPAAVEAADKAAVAASAERRKTSSRGSRRSRKAVKRKMTVHLLRISKSSLRSSGHFRKKASGRARSRAQQGAAGRGAEGGGAGHRRRRSSRSPRPLQADNTVVLRAQMLAHLRARARASAFPHEMSAGERERERKEAVARARQQAIERTRRRLRWRRAQRSAAQRQQREGADGPTALAPPPLHPLPYGRHHGGQMLVLIQALEKVRDHVAAKLCEKEEAEARALALAKEKTMENLELQAQLRFLKQIVELQAESILARKPLRLGPCADDPL